MSHVNNIAASTSVQKIVANPIQREVAANAPPQLRATDKLELSGVSHLLASLKTQDVRVDKVAELRQQIQAGTYDQDGSKFEASVDKVLEDLS
ncbi:MAG: flagellar biosynthesis anti-sigma factor FlgM [Planctomycetota bacterium]|nr:flagellar biosynthesis anti-sigma factor FlgM [Planctomycetota bacterium]